MSPVLMKLIFIIRSYNLTSKLFDKFPAPLARFIRRLIFKNNKVIKYEIKSFPRVLNPRVSVILPNYNHGKYLNQAIESLITQSYSNLEIIIVDDGSTDNSRSVIDALSKKHNLKVYYLEHNGLTAALNFGFSKSSGDFLTWTSADNYLASTAIEFLSNNLCLQNESGMIYSDYSLIDQDGFPANSTKYRKYDQDDKNKEIIRNCREGSLLNYLPDNYIGPFFMFRRGVYDRVGEYRDLLGFEDYDYWLRICAISEIKHVHSDGNLYKYRIHADTLTSKAIHSQTHRRLFEYLHKNYGGNIE